MRSLLIWNLFSRLSSHGKSTLVELFDSNPLYSYSVVQRDQWFHLSFEVPKIFEACLMRYRIASIVIYAILNG